MSLDSKDIFFTKQNLFKHLVGEKVVVYTTGNGYPLTGTLKDFNGVVLHLTNDVSLKNTYVLVDCVVAIAANK